MASVRAAIGNGADAAEVQARAEAAEALLDRAEATISDNASAGATTAFVGALVILLREGLEALLIVIAMMAFLRKAERTEAMPYVHGGWIGALVAGGATWLAATYLIDISGASRELTRSEEHTSELQSLMRISYAVFCLKKKKNYNNST